MDIQNTILEHISSWLREQGIADIQVQLTQPEDATHGDYTTNIALIAGKKLAKSPKDVAEALKTYLTAQNLPFVKDVAVAGPGFVNIFLAEEVFISRLKSLLGGEKESVLPTDLSEKRMMVEFAHPNTHKEMHIGHMRTLITGEALARLFAAGGAKVFRANYQGDIGLHVAKAMYGIDVLLNDRSQTFADAEKLSNTEKAHFLGEAYARGSVDYEKEKEKIDTINRELYAKTGPYWQKYEETRKWSLDYYDDFYTRFYTHFDRLFFESEMTERGRDIVSKNANGEIFEKSQGAIVFPGEKYGLHTRVFITKAGIPTYEGKDVGNAYTEYEAFPFDKNIHVVANEQAGYFQVVFKALSLLDPEKFKDSMYHLSMGMVQLTDRKMSSRTGEVLTVDWLIDQVKARVYELMTERKLGQEGRDEVAEEIAIGAIKYSVLKVSTGQNVAFSIETSVSLEGDSGPYLQYTYARTRSVLRKAESEGYMADGPAKQDPPLEDKWEITNGANEKINDLRFKNKEQTAQIDSGSEAGMTKKGWHAWGTPIERPQDVKQLRTLASLKSRRSGSNGGNAGQDPIENSNSHLEDRDLLPEEEALVKTLYRFDDVVREAAEKYSPNIVCSYLFELAKAYNLFYQKLPILKESSQIRDARLIMTEATGNVLQHGLDLLGIKAPEKM